MTTKVNPHGEAGLNPENYSFIEYFDANPPWEGMAAAGFATEYRKYLEEIKAELRAKSTSVYNPVGRCAHCGNGIRYHVVLEDRRDGARIAIGEDCAGNRFELTGREWKARKRELDEMRERAREGAKHIKLRKKFPEAVAFLEEALAEERGLHEEIIRRSREDDEREAYGDARHGNADLYRAFRERWPDFVLDIARKMVQYRDLSPKQAEAVARAVPQHRERIAKRKQERDNAGPVPEGNGLAIEGQIVSIKTHDGAYGTTLKMVVKHDDGWAVWGTVPDLMLDWSDGRPNQLTPHLRGSRVRFVANVTRAPDDSSFGFFKRPRKPELLAPAEAEA